MPRPILRHGNIPARSRRLMVSVEQSQRSARERRFRCLVLICVCIQGIIAQDTGKGPSRGSTLLDRNRSEIGGEELYVRTLPDEGWGRGGPLHGPCPCPVGVVPPSPPAPAPSPYLSTAPACPVHALPRLFGLDGKALPSRTRASRASFTFRAQSSPPLGISGNDGISEGTLAHACDVLQPVLPAGSPSPLGIGFCSRPAVPCCSGWMERRCPSRARARIA